MVMGNLYIYHVYKCALERKTNKKETRRKKNEGTKKITHSSEKINCLCTQCHTTTTSTTTTTAPISVVIQCVYIYIEHSIHISGIK